MAGIRWLLYIMSDQLKLSVNSKVKFSKNHRNSFGLTYGLPKDGGTCCGATKGAGGCLDVIDGHKRQTCYVAKIVQIYKATGKVLLDNTEQLLGKSREEMAEVLRNTVAQFVKDSPAEQRYFRIHWSGDFFSEDYARAWAQVISEFPLVRFWVYTRSFHLVQYLVDQPNLSVYLSIDPVNEKTGYAVYELYKDKPNLGLAWLGDNPPANYRWVTCPETSGILKNTKERGACAKCRLCIDRYKTKIRSIRFLIH
jgi:hypothetical protein